MKQSFSLIFVFIIASFSLGQSDTISLEKIEVNELNQKSSIEIPVFSNPEVQKFANDYNEFFKEIMHAAKTGNQEKITYLQTKAVEWAQRAQEVLTKMTPEDAKLWSEWSHRLYSGIAE